jgi:hypothetical protein
MTNRTIYTDSTPHMGDLVAEQQGQVLMLTQTYATGYRQHESHQVVLSVEQLREILTAADAEQSR